MKFALAIIAAASICAAVPASAEDVGLRVGPVGAGVTVGQDHRDYDRDRTTVIRENDQPRDKTVIIKDRDRDREPETKTIIHER